MYHNYIFDLYGTLVDIRTDENDPELWRKTADWYGKHAAFYSAEELRGTYLLYCAEEQGKSPDPLYELELRTVFRRLYIRKGVFPSRELTEETAVFFRKASMRKLRVYPWVFPAFRKIREKGGRIYLLSNAQECFTVPELKELGLYGQFDGIVISSAVKVRKPSVRIMEILLERYGLEKEDCLMTGNDQRTDIAVARASGIKSLYIETETSGPYEKSPEPDKILTGEKYEKMPELLELC